MNSNMKSVIEELERYYTALNEKYFCGNLPNVLITIQSGNIGKKKAYGWFFKEKWLVSSEKTHEINMGAEYLNRPPMETIATLLHEMVHLYCFLNDISDTSNHNVYHNKKFKLECEKRDLRIEKAQTIGWSVTSPTDNLIQFIENEIVPNNDLFVLYRLPNLTTIQSASKMPKKYVCIMCGNKLNGKKGMNIICGDCDQPMEYTNEY